MTGLPLDREAITASDLALAIAHTDSLSGHLRNALTLLAHAGVDVFEAFDSDGEPALAGCRAFDRGALRDLEARLRAALVLLTTDPAYTVTAAGKLALLAEDIKPLGAC